jgi:hypothetical protein
MCQNDSAVLQSTQKVASISHEQCIMMCKCEHRLTPLHRPPALPPSAWALGAGLTSGATKSFARRKLFCIGSVCPARRLHRVQESRAAAAVFHWVCLSWAGGAVRVQRIHQGTLAVSSSGGSVRLDHITATRADINTKGATRDRRCFARQREGTG